MMQGFDGFLASKENQRKRARAYKPEDRLFSLSSKSINSIAVCDGPMGCNPAQAHARLSY